MNNIVTYQEKENIATIAIDDGKANAVSPLFSPYHLPIDTNSVCSCNNLNPIASCMIWPPRRLSNPTTTGRTWKIEAKSVTETVEKDQLRNPSARLILFFSSLTRSQPRLY